MGLRPQLAATNPAALSRQRVQALARLIWPVGKCRIAVRGLAASNLRSTMRLKAMAQVRPLTMARRISTKTGHPGQPRWSLEAIAMDAKAKGRAKIVCETFTNSPHCWIVRSMARNLALE